MMRCGCPIKSHKFAALSDQDLQMYWGPQFPNFKLSYFSIMQTFWWLTYSFSSIFSHLIILEFYINTLSILFHFVLSICLCSLLFTIFYKSYIYILFIYISITTQYPLIKYLSTFAIGCIFPCLWIGQLYSWHISNNNSLLRTTL